MITYSDEIAIDFTKYRIMILDAGLVVVRIRLSTVNKLYFDLDLKLRMPLNVDSMCVWFQKTKKEKFIDQLFSIPLLNIELHEHDAYPRKLKIIANNASHVNYTITFGATRKKKQFMDAIRTQLNLPGWSIKPLHIFEWYFPLFFLQNVQFEFI